MINNTDQMKSVLIISYFFPPSGGAGTQRTMKLCKYINLYGWKPIVITRPFNEKRGFWEPEDITLLKEIVGKVEIIQVPKLEKLASWSKHLPISGEIALWSEPAFNTAKALTKDREIDLIYITMSPFTLCHLGLHIKKETNVPVIYDLRDPWALDGWNVYSNRRSWKHDYCQMKKTLISADGIIANTPEAKTAFLNAIPKIDKKRICVIPNGYDPIDFNTEMSDKIQKEKGFFYLVHTGFLHCWAIYQYKGIIGCLKKLRHYTAEQIKVAGRTPLYLFKAINRLRKQGDSFIHKLKIIFVGHPDEATKRCVKDFGLEDIVTFTGYLSHADSINWLKSADALFLPLHGLNPGRRSLIIPGKVYEYVAANRPILACLPEGDAKNIVNESGFGVFADPCDALSIAQTLKLLYKRCTSGYYSCKTTPESLSRFERKNLVHNCVSFFNMVISLSKI